MITHNSKKNLVIQRHLFSRPQIRESFDRCNNSKKALKNYQLNRKNAIKIRFNWNIMKSFEKSLYTDKTSINPRYSNYRQSFRKPFISKKYFRRNIDTLSLESLRDLKNHVLEENDQKKWKSADDFFLNFNIKPSSENIFSNEIQSQYKLKSLCKFDEKLHRNKESKEILIPVNENKNKPFEESMKKSESFEKLKKNKESYHNFNQIISGIFPSSQINLELIEEEKEVDFSEISKNELDLSKKKTVTLSPLIEKRENHHLKKKSEEIIESFLFEEENKDKDPFCEKINGKDSEEEFFGRRIDKTKTFSTRKSEFSPYLKQEKKPILKLKSKTSIGKKNEDKKQLFDYEFEIMRDFKKYFSEGNFKNVQKRMGINKENVSKSFTFRGKRNSNIKSNKRREFTKIKGEVKL